MRNFRFLNDQLNIVFITLIAQLNLHSQIDNNGIVYFSLTDETAIEDAIIKIRNMRFHSWQVVSCPTGLVNKYRQYMILANISYIEELNDGQIEFLLSSEVELNVTI